MTNYLKCFECKKVAATYKMRLLNKDYGLCHDCAMETLSAALLMRVSNRGAKKTRIYSRSGEQKSVCNNCFDGDHFQCVDARCECVCP